MLRRHAHEFVFFGSGDGYHAHAITFVASPHRFEDTLDTKSVHDGARISAHAFATGALGEQMHGLFDEALFIESAGVSQPNRSSSRRRLREDGRLHRVTRIAQDRGTHEKQLPQRAAPTDDRDIGMRHDGRHIRGVTPEENRETAAHGGFKRYTMGIGGSNQYGDV